MEPVQTIQVLTVPQAIVTLYPAVCLAQQAGVYSLQDATQISLALSALRYRLHLDQNMQPIPGPVSGSGPGPGSSPINNTNLPKSDTNTKPI